MSETRDSLEESLTGLFPPGAAMCFSPALPDAARLRPEETEIAADMARSRRRSFTHGRFCARAAMEQLGFDPAPIGKGPDDEPLWPPGLVGSISHSGVAAAAVVAKSGDFASMGIDLETRRWLKADVVSTISLPEENPLADSERPLQLFSIKESIFKCLFPIERTLIGFKEIRVVLNEESLSFTAEPNPPRSDAGAIARIRGRSLLVPGYVISGAWIEA